MKRVMILFTSFMMMLNVSNVQAFSAEVDFVESGSNVSTAGNSVDGLVGDKISVDIYVSPTDVPTGIGTFGGVILFDDTILELDTVTPNRSTNLTFIDNLANLALAMVDFSGGTYSIKESTVLYTITFDIIAAGNTDISIGTANGIEFALSDAAASPQIVPTTVTPLSLTTTEPSSNADLATLTVSGQTLSPTFNANTTSYTVTVPYLTTSVNVAATLSDSTASLSGTGTKNLTVGNNSVTVRVTAEDGTIKNYSINIIREADSRSTDNTLSNLEIDGQTLTPTFSSSTTSYNVTVPNDITSLVVDATANDSKATVSISGNTNFKVGSNTITVKVTAENGTVRNYTINVTRQEVPKNDDTSLGSLSVTGQNINPTFNKDVTSYTLTVPFEISKLTINAVANSSTSTVGISSSNLVVGNNTITIKVTAENGDVKNYVITVTREEQIIDKNNKLQDLIVEGFNITPTFNNDIFNYSMVVPYDIDSLLVNAVAESDLASVVVTGNNNLKVGQNEIKVVVTAEDLSKREFTITVTKEAEEVIVLDSDNTLKSLDLGYSYSPIFDSLTSVYILNVENNITSLDITAIPNSDKATYEVIGNNNFKEGINSITIKVSAEDGSIRNYIVNVSRKGLSTQENTESSDNYLTLIDVVGYDISFDKNLNNYNITVPFETSALRINYLKSYSKAIVEIIGNSDFIINSVTPVEIKVKAEDGSVRIYTLNVTRSPLSSDNKLEDLKINGITINNFNTDINNYSLNLTSDEITIEATAFNENAIVTGTGIYELKEGNNTFLISIEDENSFVRYYQVNVYKEIKQDMLLTILPWVGLGLSLLAVIIILIILMRRKPVVEIAKKETEPQKTLIDFKPEFNFDSRNNTGNNEYLATQSLLKQIENKDVYDEVITKDELINAINNKDSETLKILYEQEMLNRKKEELKKSREDEWGI